MSDNTARCVRAHSTALLLGKRYSFIPDSNATLFGLIRIVNESGEERMYPQRWFDVA